MKVTHDPVHAYLRTSVQGPAPARPPKTVESGAQADDAKRDAGDATKVSISREGLERARAATGATAGDEAQRASKVQELKAQVASGTFKVKSDVVARRMLDVEG